MNKDHSHRNRRYYDKVKEYKSQQPFRIKVFAGAAVEEAKARGLRLWHNMAKADRPSSPRPTLIDPDRLDVPMCVLCDANRAELVCVPCDHCGICRQCASRHRIMSGGSASTERRNAEWMLSAASQQLRSAHDREEGIRTPPSAPAAGASSLREQIEAEKHEATAKLATARYLLHVSPRTTCAVCSFRIDAVLSLERIAQLRRAYGGSARLPDEFVHALRHTVPEHLPKAREAFLLHVARRVRAEGSLVSSPSNHSSARGQAVAGAATAGPAGGVEGRVRPARRQAVGREGEVAAAALQAAVEASK
jgi:hypothetical protein